MTNSNSPDHRQPLYLDDLKVGDRFHQRHSQDQPARDRVVCPASRPASRRPTRSRGCEGFAVRRPDRQRLAHRGDYDASDGGKRTGHCRRHGRHGRRFAGPTQRGRGMSCMWKAKSWNCGHHEPGPTSASWRSAVPRSISAATSCRCWSRNFACRAERPPLRHNETHNVDKKSAVKHGLT